MAQREKIDILFIDPPWIIESKDNIWKYVSSCLPSLGIAYIAAYLQRHDFSCKIIDCTAEGIAVDDFRKRVGSILPRFIGITATTPLVVNGLMIARICKAILPDARIVFGGVHPTVMPDEVLRDECVDYVVRGEGEETTRELLAGTDPGNILGLSYKLNGEIFHNPDRPLIEDLDSIPPPAYHLLPIEKYRPAVGSYKRLPAMSIFATRGCPGRCSFCYRIFGKRVRCRSALRIIEEIEILQRNYGIKEICFYDDTLTLFDNEIKQLCSEIIARRMDLTWSCFTRLDYVSEELLCMMKQAGCHLILFGIESGDEQILRNINKKIDLGLAKRVISMARKIGIETRAAGILYVWQSGGD
ncbi:MAG: radical SAM protein [bacterium]